MTVHALWREGDYWAVKSGEREARIRHSKGLAQLAELVAHPGVERHALELAGAGGAAAGGAGAMLDREAKEAYRARIEDLRTDAEQAAEWGDADREAKAREELDALGRELARAVGLGGRDREAASDAERARQNVGRAINKAVRRIADELPDLGAHLERAVHTGTYCAYRPEPEPPVRVLGQPPAAAPPGTLAFMLTDVEGSTRLYVERPDAGDLIELQARTVAESAERFGGRVIKGRGEGDSTFSVFARPADALACALDVQRALADGSIAIRIAVHAGEAELRDGDYHGVEVNRCARIRDLGHGGEVLVSAAAAALATDRLPDGAALREAGRQQLRGFERPERVYRLSHPDLRDDFPPLVDDGPAHNLPPRLSSFIGREQECAKVAELLGDARLVTLTGAGGAGKTRLALEVAERVTKRLEGGAWFADLAPVSEPALVQKAVAAALGLRERPHVPLLDDIAERLREAETLIVLDNCEHLADESARVVDDLLQSAPLARVLATSREPLGVPGEVVRRTGSLDLPEEGAPFEAVVASEAVRLLAARAAAVVPGFELTPATAPVAARICRRLDGLPLAIELAAARLSALSLHDLAARLDDCFALLTGGARTALPRQRTLEATVAWSYDLLGDVQRVLFDRLSVFAGGWPLDAAQEVCALGGLTQRDVVEGLAALVDKSLVVRDELPDGRVRYRMLETLRQYARTRLQERGEVQHVRDTHLAWAVRLSETVEPELFGLDQAIWLERLEEELGNLRAAVEWALASGDAESGLRIVSIAIGGFWMWRGHATEAFRLLERLLDSPAAISDGARARGLLTAGRLSFQIGHWENGVRLCRESRELSRSSGDAIAEARAIVWQTINEWGAKRDIRQTVEECVEVARGSGGMLETALATGLAGMWWAEHDLGRASTLADEAGELIAHVPSPNWLAHINEFRAYVAYKQGDRDTACRLLGDALPLYHQIANKNCGAHCLETAALLAAAVGAPELAAELLGAAGGLREELGTVAPAYEELVRDTGIEEIAAALEEDEMAAARERGRGLGFDAAIERAVAVTRR